MRSGLLFALAVFLPAVECALFECDSELKVVAGDLVTMPCMIKFEAFGQALWKQEFWLETKECSKGFRIYGDVRGTAFDREVTEENNEVELPLANIPGLSCKTVRFDDISTSEDGVSFCPTFNCRFMKDPDCVAIHVDDSCLGMTSCSACTSAPGCGWCYDSERCLPKSTTSDIDRCSYCEDWTSDQCPECVDNCGGHGTCEDRICTCEQDWTGTDTCNIYTPPATVCEQSPTERIPILLHPTTYSDGMYHAAIHVEGKVSYLAVEASEKDLNIYTRSGNRVYPMQYEYRTGEIDDTDCLKADGPLAILRLNPSIPTDSDIWVAVEMPLSQPTEDVNIAVVVGVCREGMYGWPCDTPSSEVDIETDEADTTQTENGESRTITRTVGILKGASHYASYPVPAETVRIDAVITEDDLKKHVVAKYYHEGAEVASYKDTAPTTDAGVLLSLTNDYDKSWAEAVVKFTLETEEPRYDNVMRLGENELVADWGVGEEWVILRISVPQGVNKVEVFARTGVVGTVMYAAHGVRPVKGSKIESRSGEVLLTHPKAGYWYIGVYKSSGVRQEEVVTFSVGMARCIECDATHCDTSHSTVLLTNCDEVGCHATTSSYPLSQCVDTPVATADPEPLPLPVINPTTPLSPPPSTSDDKPKLLFVAIIGGAIAICLVAGGVFATLSYNKWKVKQDQTRREKGGYDFAPQTAELEMDSEDPEEGCTVNSSHVGGCEVEQE